MQRSILINISFICFAAIIIFALVFSSSRSSQAPTEPAINTEKITTITPTPPSEPVPNLPVFTVSQVVAHKTKTDCWSIIRGNVYDLTNWISMHPGGSAAIISLCGIDGTTKFVAQHNGQANPEAELASLRVGTVAK